MEPAITAYSEDEESELDSDDLDEIDLIEGDNLNPGAVMWGLTSLDDYDTTTIYEHLGVPRKYDLGWLWKPGELVKPATIPEMLRDDRIYLGDFGMAIKDDTPVPTKVQTPTQFCAPERFHGVDPSSASDMWSYMYIFSWIYLGFVPVQRRGGVGVMSDLVGILGPLPEHWHGYFKCGKEQGSDGWYDQSQVPIEKMTLTSLVAGRQSAVSQEEQELVGKFLRRCFAISLRTA
ncbi:putative Dual specificity protein kinase CLK1 [Glarea lozoyensis 74030]|uniref:Putative Dual specificity protein kinase CLK1 n=1 Tax=Glarea lozoyensis (strain ATCC 74030 / MF5533) TaxID=1104152 RepID=H0EWS1_GLAL7|nr:putative Dual specificity protein kinase CLK1 [Glarea lozoyensis 74030]